MAPQARAEEAPAAEVAADAEHAPSPSDAVADAYARLIAAGIAHNELQASLDDAKALLLEHPEAHACLDVVVDLAWIACTLPSVLWSRLGKRWRADEPERVRAHLAFLRNERVRAAAAARREIAKATQPEQLNRRIRELISAGKARTRTEAFEVLARELCKSPEYIRRRAGRDPDASR